MEEKRTGIEIDWCGNEGRIMSATIGRHFANEVSTVWFTDVTKKLCNLMFRYTYFSPLVFSFTTIVFCTILAR